MVQIRDLEFSYRGTDFSLIVPFLALERGGHSAWVGASGCGKTTLLNLVAGIFPLQRGTIHVGETELSTLSDAGRRDFRIANVGFVFQEFELLEYLNVIENILLPYLINSSLVLTPAVREAAGGLAESMGLGDRLSRSVTRLSQGEKQRVAICRALLPNPGLILADEPTGNLDPKNKHRILKLLFEHVEKSGTTLVMVTHDHALLDDFDRVIDFAQFAGGMK